MKTSDMPFKHTVSMTCPACETTADEYFSIHNELPKEGELFHCGSCLTNLIVVPDGVRIATMEEIQAWLLGGGFSIDGL